MGDPQVEGDQQVAPTDDRNGGAFPCHEGCGRLSEVEHQGKALCPQCAAKLPGASYPLRGPSRKPLYSRGEIGELARQLSIRARRGAVLG